MNKRILPFVLTFLIALCAVMQPALAAEVQQGGLSFKDSELALRVGDKQELEVQVAEALAGKKLTYSSSSSRVAAVSSKGVVTAKKAGTATITVKTGKVSASLKITVYEKAKSVTLPERYYSILPGKTLQLSPEIKPAGAEQTITYSTNNEKVATVSATGLITGVKEGRTIIIVKGPDGTETSCNITVTKSATEIKTGSEAATSVSLNRSYLLLERGNTYSLQATLTPKNADAAITYKSSNAKVATVDKDGKITAVKVGKATITAEASGKKSAACEVEVVKKSGYAIKHTRDATMLSFLMSMRTAMMKSDASLPAYQENAKLQKAAEKRALEIAANYEAQSEDTARIKTLIKEQGLSYKNVREYVARSGESTGGLFTSLVAQYSDFKGVLTGKTYKYIAVAFVLTDNNSYDYWVIVFAG